MSYKDFKDSVDLARAHGLAMAEMNVPQAYVSVMFYKTGAKVYGFSVCRGACPKCDRYWIEIRKFLSGIEMVEVRPSEATAPSEAVKFTD